MINIIGGKFRKKKIDVPFSEVRPTSSLKREAIFSIIESYASSNGFNPYTNKCFIDLFAGSGSFGLEAISRGANFSYFYEVNFEVYKVLLKNCNAICKKNEFIIYNQDGTLIENINVDFPISAIFLDPPYKTNPFETILKKILDKKILDKDSLIIIETDNKKEFLIPDQLKVVKQKIYNKSKIIFLKELR